MKDKLSTAVSWFVAIAVLSGIVTLAAWFESGKFRDCRSVGHSQAFCFARSAVS